MSYYIQKFFELCGISAIRIVFWPMHIFYFYKKQTNLPMEEIAVAWLLFWFLVVPSLAVTLPLAIIPYLLWIIGGRPNRAVSWNQETE